LPVTDRIQLVALGVSLTLFVAVFELVRRRKLTEEYSYLWIASSLLLLGLAVKRDALDTAAEWLGVFYPPTLLLLLLILIVFVASLCFSVIVSRQRKQIERLMEETAILSAELRELRQGPPNRLRGLAPPAAHVVASAPDDSAHASRERA
jgi:hypothetical protein